MILSVAKSGNNQWFPVTATYAKKKCLSWFSGTVELNSVLKHSDDYILTNFFMLCFVLEIIREIICQMYILEHKEKQEN